MNMRALASPSLPDRSAANQPTPHIRRLPSMPSKDRRLEIIALIRKQQLDQYRKEGSK
jgi:hypothetical protein